jgi:hypothetical protein
VVAYDVTSSLYGQVYVVVGRVTAIKKGHKLKDTKVDFAQKLSW